MQMKFTIQGELTDLNAYIKALNSHYIVGNKIKQKETDRVAWEVVKSNLVQVKKYPIVLKYMWFCKDNKKDVDNVAFAKKFINDGLVLSGILENDTRKHVCGFIDEFYIDKKNPRVEVEIQNFPQSTQ